MGEYGGLLANRSFGGAQVSRTFYARGQTGQQLLLGAYQAIERQIVAGGVKMFPRSEMPLPIYLLTFVIPVTYFIEILRGIVLRGADFRDLVPQIIGLSICCVVILGLSIGRFQKKLK